MTDDYAAPMGETDGRATTTVGVVPVSPLRRLVLAAVPLSSGGAVMVAIVFSSDSLILPTLLLLAGAGATAFAVARGLSSDARRSVYRRLVVGVWAGMPATIVYDLIRYAAVAVAGWSVRPFGAFALFGQMLIGQGQPRWAQYLVGTGFHLVNGLGFAAGYAVVFRRPAWPSAVAWALVLEAMTIVFYPSWLGITALGEFVSMSMIGHLAYGLVLGPAVSYRLARAGSSTGDGSMP